MPSDSAPPPSALTHALDQSGGSQNNTVAAAAAADDALSPLEQEVLDEYARLLGNLNNLSALLGHLAANPSPEILDSLRGLERKTSLVFTLLKASVYSILLQEQIGDDMDEAER